MTVKIARVLLWCVVLLCCQNAFAGSYQTSTAVTRCGNDDSQVISAATPFLVAEAAADYFASGPGPCDTAIRNPRVGRQGGGAGTWRISTHSISGGSPFNAYGITVVTPDSCWEAAKPDFVLNALYDPGSLPPSAALCQVCPEGEEWNEEEAQCEPPDCEEGEIHDDEIDACRQQCEENEVYLYESQTCKLQCQPGKTSAYGYLGNRSLDVEGEVFTVNGCPATAHVQCAADTEGYIGQTFGAQHITGQMCLITFSYTEEIEQTVEFQVVYEDELAGEFGYSGEGAGEASLDGEVEEPTVAEWHDLTEGGLEPFSIGNRKYVCRNGTAAWVYEVDGVEGEIEVVGACPTDNEELDTAASSPQAIAPQLQGLAEGQEEQTGILAEIQGAIASLGGEESPFNIEWGEFTAPEGEPGYERQHEDGLSDVLGEDDLSDTELSEALDSAVPDFSAITAPACFAWEFETMFTGPFTFEPPCFMWDVLANLVLAMAAFIAWQIIFVRT